MSDSEICLPVESNAPAQHAAAVTPHDTNKLSKVSRGLWVGTAGNIVVTMPDGDDVTIVNASGLIPLAVIRVKSTDTTASNIVALW